LQTAVRKSDWKDGLDNLLASFRDEFIYDNVAVYLLDAQGNVLRTFIGGVECPA